MPGIDLESGYTPGSTIDTELGKVSATLLDENTVKGEILSEDVIKRRECNKKAERIMMDWGLVATAIALIIFSSLLFFAMIKIQHARNGYSDVIVTPYPNLVALNTTDGEVEPIITIPCYYPPSTDYLNFPVNCSFNSNYFCPTNYVCLQNSAVFDSPYIGCVSTIINCGDLNDCAMAIDSMPDESESSKYFSLDYSPWISITFGLLVFPLTILLSVLAVVKLFRKEGNVIEKHMEGYEFVASVVVVLVYAAVAIIGGLVIKYLAIGYDYGQHCFSDLSLNAAITSTFDYSMEYYTVYLLAVFGLFFPFGMVVLSSPAYFCKLIRKRNNNVVTESDL